MAASRKWMIALGLVTGMVVGGIGSGVLVGAMGFFAARSAGQEAREGWNLVPAVVAARALEPGEKPSRDAFAQRNVPEQLLTASVVKPDSVAYVTDQMITVPLHSGDLVHWGFFSVTRGGLELESPQDFKIWEACETARAASPTARRESTPEAIRARLSSVPAGEGP
jgi:pilus assembly protein CpaB